jgi:Mg2+/Co2+ transporter CorC
MVLTVMARGFLFVEIALGLVAIFFIVWGIAPEDTESVISRLIGRKYARKCLRNIDLIWSPRDRTYDEHIRTLIIGYNDDLQKALRKLMITRNPMDLTSQQWERFHADRLVDSNHNRGPVKNELRDIIGWTLDDLGI